MLETRQIAGSLWFRVEILNGDECGERQPRSVLTGWIPAYGEASQPTAWFYAQGC